MSGEYTRLGLWYGLRKVFRYVGLYGVARTLIKIKAQYHMRATATFEGARWTNPACREGSNTDRNVALIGCGNFAFSNIAFYLGRNNSKFLRATYDSQPNRSLSLCKAYGGAYAVADWREILSDQQISTVFIASNHATHAEYAIACINADKHVHIEKPHVVSQQQLSDLLAAMRQHPEVKVFLGFNRPRSRLFLRLQDALAEEHGSLMINWFIAGHEISDTHWYYDEKEGGRVLGNLAHWTDLTLHLVSLEKAFPCTIVPASPVGSKSDFMVSMLFADGSCAAVTFSAKGKTFEGVREVLNLQKGDILANITEFSSLTIDKADKKIFDKPFFRDHGHCDNITHSAICSVDNTKLGETEAYIVATARFFLAVKQAIDGGTPITLSRAEAFGLSI
jgi:predicted dehydrogenase